MTKIKTYVTQSRGVEVEVVRDDDGTTCITINDQWMNASDLRETIRFLKKELKKLEVMVGPYLH